MNIPWKFHTLIRSVNILPLSHPTIGSKAGFNWSKCVIYTQKAMCHAHSTLKQPKWTWIKCTHLISNWLENMTLLQIWPIHDASSYDVLTLFTCFCHIIYVNNESTAWSWPAHCKVMPCACWCWWLSSFQRITYNLNPNSTIYNRNCYTCTCYTVVVTLSSNAKMVLANFWV